jgi:hypothetical protein
VGSDAVAFVLLGEPGGLFVFAEVVKGLKEVGYQDVEAVAFGLAKRGAHWILTVRGNQRRLHAQLTALPWRAVPDAPRDTDRGHGRREIRTGTGPEVMAALRNAAMGALGLTGVTNIAAANRHHARDSTCPLALLGITWRLCRGPGPGPSRVTRLRSAGSTACFRSERSDQGRGVAMINS